MKGCFSTANIFRDFISLPSIAVKLMSDELCRKNNGSTGFVVPSLEVCKKIRAGIVGGLSVVMTRETLKGITPIRSHIYRAEDACIAKYTTSYDLKSSYPAAMKRLEVAGIGILRKKEDGYAGTYDVPRFEKNFWAELIGAYYAWKWKVKWIQTGLVGSEYQSHSSGRKYKVDIVLGLGGGQKIAIESYGHAHYCTYCGKGGEPSDMHPLRNKLNSEVAKEDRKRITALKKEFHQVHVIYVCWFKAEIMTGSSFLDEFLPAHPQFSKRVLSRRKLKLEKLIELLKSGEMVGMLCAALEIPAEKQAFFDQFPPLFKKAKLTLDDLDPQTADFCRANKVFSKSKVEIIQCFSAPSMVLTTPLLRWLLGWGVKVNDILWVVEYQKSDALAEFVDRVGEMRREAAESGKESAKLFSNCKKILINSVYGSVLRNDEKNTLTSFVTQESEIFSRASRMTSLEDIGQIYEEECRKNLYLVQEKKKKGCFSLPSQIGIDILSTSKLRLFEFAFDLLGCFDPRSYSLILSDTDSITWTRAENTWEEMETKWLLPGMRESYWRAKKALLYDPSERHRRFEAGLFHDEFPGGIDIVVAVSPKCYIFTNWDDEFAFEIIKKLALKGVSTKHRKALESEDFLNVVRNKTSAITPVCQLRFKSGLHHFITFDKVAFSFRNLKRYWYPDGVNSRALSV